MAWWQDRETLTRDALRRIQAASRGSFTAVVTATSELREEKGRAPTVDEVVERLELNHYQREERAAQCARPPICISKQR